VANTYLAYTYFKIMALLNLSLSAPFTTQTPRRSLKFNKAHELRTIGVHAAHEQSNQGVVQITSSAATSRRALLASTLLAAPLFSSPAAVLAEETATISTTGATKVFFDIAVDRAPLGRIVIAVDGATTGAEIGAQRFLDLTKGIEGTSFRRTKIELLQDTYIQGSGLKSLSRKANEETAITGGPDVEFLENEMVKSTAKHDKPGVVSFVVKRTTERDTKDKLVAVNGQFVTVTNVLGGELPNGSCFAITTKPEPSLDNTNLVVGHVVEGQDVVEAIAALPRVKDNSSSPFFKAGKAGGDGRARVAERAFNKAYAKIVIMECGLL
jgi:peptidyl-prolyl cis-trans isomerase B (cyclophilin B)